MRYIYRKVARRNGKFISMREARAHPETSIIDSIPCRVGPRPPLDLRIPTQFVRPA
jgi:hypothetical protein